MGILICLAFLSSHITPCSAGLTLPPSPLVSCSARLQGNHVVISHETKKPAFARFQLRVAGKKLTVLAHLHPETSNTKLSLAGLGPIEAKEVLWEVEFRYRRYAFERVVGGTGTTEGRFRDPCHIMAASRNRIFVVDRGNDRIQCFDYGYRYLFEFGGFAWNATNNRNEAEQNKFDEPSAIAEGHNKELYVVDRANNRIVRCDPFGRFLGQFGNDKLRLPEGIATDHFGSVVVCDTDNDRLLRFDTDGRYHTEIGGYGWGALQFNHPAGAAFDPAGNLYVVDEGNERVQVYDKSLRPIVEIRVEGVRPRAIGIDAEHFVYLVDEKHARVLVLDKAFRTIHQLPEQNAAWRLTRPVALALTRDGRLHILDQAKALIAVVLVEQDVLVRRGKIEVAAPR